MSAKNVSFFGGTASLTLYWFVSIWRSVFTFAQGMKPECRGPNTQAVVSEPQRGAVPKNLHRRNISRNLNIKTCFSLLKRFL